MRVNLLVMTTMQEHTLPAHPADQMTTVARVRLYDGPDRDSQSIGFNCRAEDYLDLGAIGTYVREKLGYDVAELQPRSSLDKPFVTAALEVRPPLALADAGALGHLLVQGEFSQPNADQLEGIMLIDNTGNQQPDHPLDRGRDVINETPIQPRAAR